jgi:hypothetical protein
VKYFKGLIKKDWKLAQRDLWQSFAIILIVWMAGLGASFYWNEPAVVMTIGLLLIAMHIFYIPTDMFLSMSKEQKLKIYLHNPNPALVLLSSKMLVSILACLLSIAFSIGLYLVSCIIFKELPLQEHGPAEAVIFIGTILGSGIYLGIWALFSWSLFTILKKKRYGYFWIFIAGISTWIVIQLHQVFYSSSIYERLKSYGTTPIVGFGTQNIENDDYMEMSIGVEMGEFSIALGGVFILVSLVVIFLSARNVEKIEI